MLVHQCKFGERKSLDQSSVSKSLGQRVKLWNLQMILSESLLHDFAYGKKNLSCLIVYSPSLPILFSYGLAGAVISNDEERCQRISKVT